MPVLNMAANLGLILFLFVVGLETDLRLLKANAKVAGTVSGASLVIPFGLGAAIAVGLYNEFGQDEGTKQVNLGVFILFIGIAMAITVSALAINIYLYIGIPQNLISVLGSLGVPSPCTYLDGTKASRHKCRSHHAFSWCW